MAVAVPEPWLRLGRARAFAVGHASRLGLPSERLDDVALAVGLLATNSNRLAHRAGRDRDPAALPLALVITERAR
ncbi:MAG: hypothetical protein ACRD0P_31650, partial [Stackebrandtia sp.]